MSLISYVTVSLGAIQLCLFPGTAFVMKNWYFITCDIPAILPSCCDGAASNGKYLSHRVPLEERMLMSVLVAGLRTIDTR